MAFPCGCEFTPGEPLELDMLKKHFEHTLGNMVMWELFQRKGLPQPVPNPLTLARIAYIEALEGAFPEIHEE